MDRTQVLRKHLVTIVVLANSIFWIWFWLGVSQALVVSEKRLPAFEEVVPVYRFGDWVLPPFSDKRIPEIVAIGTVQQPTLWLTARAVEGIAGQDWSATYGYCSIGAIILIVTSMASFVQWAGLALLVGKLVR